jgi:tetratricopeptide (TPR) repeat protein
VSPDVYDLYLRGLHLRNSFTKEGVEKAIQLFQQAIARDSTYAPLYSDLGWAYMQLADGYYAPREVIPQAKAAVERALALDDSLSQAHTNLAALYQQYLFNWDGTMREADRALQLNPDNAEAYLWRAARQVQTGDVGAALESVRRGLDLDPLSIFMNFSAIWFNTIAGMPDSAISRYHRIQELSPGFFYLETFVDDAYRMKGQLDSAVAITDWGSKQAGRPLGGQVLNLVQLGRRAEAERLFNELEAVAAKRYIPPEILARAALALGDKEKCLTYLERGVDAQSALVQSVTWYPEYRELIGHPRFERYLERVHLTETMHRLGRRNSVSPATR